MRPVVITSTVALILSAAAAPALAADPVQAPIANFDDKLLSVMKDAKTSASRAASPSSSR